MKANAHGICMVAYFITQLTFYRLDLMSYFGKISTQAIAIDIIAAVLLLLFSYTAFSKIVDRSVFEYVLRSSPLIGKYAWAISWLLPAVELAVSICLFVTSAKKMGFFLSAILLFLFTSYLVFMLSSGEKLPCACGGVVAMLGWKLHIVLNVVAICLSLTGLFLCGGRLFNFKRAPP